jgi:hypothetical protein
VWLKVDGIRCKTANMYFMLLLCNMVCIFGERRKNGKMNFGRGFESIGYIT